LQLNFLVYPGTSGGAHIDYLVADPVVVPPEHAVWYTEKLLYLPGTYQVREVARHPSQVLARVAWCTMWAVFGFVKCALPP